MESELVGRRRGIDVDPSRAAERRRQAEEQRREGEPARKPAFDPAEEYKRLMELKSGGRYVPPARLRALQAQMAADKDSKEYQRLKWEELKKNINGAINKANTQNIRDIAVEIFSLNIIRGRGLFARSLIKAQALALTYTPVYAALVAIVNSKLPQVGELVLRRLVIQFRRAFKRNDKAASLASCLFLAHLCNQQVAHEIIALQILHLLLQNPTDDSVEICVGFVRAVGMFLSEASPVAFEGVFEQLRSVLHDGSLQKRTQYMIEVLFQVRRDGFASHPSVPEDLDLVEEDDQNTHLISLDDELKAEEVLNVFRFDEEYEANEEKYLAIKNAILGGDSDEEEEEEEGDEDEEVSGRSDEESVSGRSDDEDEEPTEAPATAVADRSRVGDRVVIEDMTDADKVNLRRTIYLTIKSTMSSEEVSHKLLRIRIPEGHEMELVNMVIESCMQEKNYEKVYGRVGQQLCMRGRFWRQRFEDAFRHYYEVLHRFDSNKLRNMAKMFGYMLGADAMDWAVFDVVRMNERDSTASSRIFLKFLFEEIRAEIGIARMKHIVTAEHLQPALANMLPKASAEDTRFSINFFTAIGLGALTEDMREYLKNMPPEPEPEPEPELLESESESVVSRRSSLGSRGRDYSRSPSVRSGSSRERSYSRSPYSDRGRSRSRSYSRSPSPRGRSYSRGPRGRSYSRSPRGRSYSRSPRGRSYSRSPRDRSYSRSPRGRDYSRSPSPRGRSYSRSPSPRGRSYSRTPRDRSLSTTPPRRRSYSRSPPRRRSYSRTPPRRRSYSRSPGRGPSRGRSYSRSPARVRGRSYSSSRSRSLSRSPSPRPKAGAVVSRNRRSGERRLSDNDSRSPPRPTNGRASRSPLPTSRRSRAAGDEPASRDHRKRPISQSPPGAADSKRRARAADYY